MALYAIGDTHLSLSVDKPMDVFGGGWRGYVDKLREGFSVVKAEDTVVLCGDLSWGMSLEQAEQDFAFLDALPGRKILLKGNHDYWWTTAAKMERFFAEHGFLPWRSCTTTAACTASWPCAAPGDGFTRRTVGNTARRFLTGS